MQLLGDTFPPKHAVFSRGIGLLRDLDGFFHATNSMSIYPDTGVCVIKPDKPPDNCVLTTP